MKLLKLLCLIFPLSLATAYAQEAPHNRTESNDPVTILSILPSMEVQNGRLLAKISHRGRTSYTYTDGHLSKTRYPDGTMVEYF